MILKTMFRLIAGVVLVLLLVFAATYVVCDVFEFGAVAMPRPPRVMVIPARQGWSGREARAFHHTSQGTKILPYKWFMALEQPSLNRLLPSGRLASRDYLARFGFLYDDSERPAKGDDLPIGFAIEDEFHAPYAMPPVKEKTKVVGLTCAACHTGRIDLRDEETGRIKGLLIEGGSAMINLTKFQEATGLALAYTVMFPERFHRFAEEVIGRKDIPHDDPDKIALKSDLKAYVDIGIAGRDYAKEHKLSPVEAGFSRTDALGLIGNRVFGVLNNENQTVTDAPVNFPHLWDTPWFDWVQYNASIRMPLSRNIGEALGVGAVVNLGGEENPYETTVNLEGLHWMESLIGGDQPFKGLQPPKWDEALLGKIERPKADAGKALYKTHCVRCHLPPREELIAHIDDKEYDKYWAKDPSGKKFLKVRPHDLAEIGTDPNQALNFYRRVAVVPKDQSEIAPSSLEPFKLAQFKTISAEQGLFLVTGFIRRNKYESLGLFKPEKEKERAEFDRWRTLTLAGKPVFLDTKEQILKGIAMAQVIEANLGYKPRPLDGIWATPPYLHNGSVPSLYQMLVPVERRSKVFYLGTTRFDARHVGYQADPFPGAFAIDTSISGNQNIGHEFRNLRLEELEAAWNMPWDGRMGREERWTRVLKTTPDGLEALSDQERWEKIRNASLEAMKLGHFKGYRGVIGVEFTEEERWQLVEYLKTL